MMTHKQKQLVAAVQGAMGVSFRVRLVNADDMPDEAFFQLEAVDLLIAGKSARSHPYARNSARPLSELSGLCANTLKSQLQTHHFPRSDTTQRSGCRFVPFISKSL